MSTNWTAVKTEIAKPAYNGMSDAQVATALNALTASTTRASVDASEVYEAIVQSEYAALTSAFKQQVSDLLGMGSLNPNGTNTRAAFAAIFGNGTTTRTNLLALSTRTVSFAESVGLSRTFDYADIPVARAS